MNKLKNIYTQRYINDANTPLSKKIKKYMDEGYTYYQAYYRAKHPKKKIRKYVRVVQEDVNNG